MYECVGELGFFLFNDALVLSERRETHVPFSPAVNVSYTFLASVALHSLTVSEIMDTKCEYIQNHPLTKSRHMIIITSLLVLDSLPGPYCVTFSSSSSCCRCTNEFNFISFQMCRMLFTWRVRHASGSAPRTDTRIRSGGSGLCALL